MAHGLQVSGANVIKLLKSIKETGAVAGRFNYFAELETAGKCLEWVKDHPALGEIGIYLQKVPAKKERVPRRRNTIMC